MTRDRSGRAEAVTTNVLQGEDRDAVWKEIIAAMPNFGEYERQTTRTIPVIALDPR